MLSWTDMRSSYERKQHVCLTGAQTKNGLTRRAFGSWGWRSFSVFSSMAEGLADMKLVSTLAAPAHLINIGVLSIPDSCMR